jgi:hypothetical protein
VSLTRSLRGLAGIGIFWGIAWGTALALVDFILWMSLVRHWPVHPPLGHSLYVEWLFGFAIGFVGGAMFSVLLAIAERKRSVDALSVPRAALWGAIAAALFAFPSIFLRSAFQPASMPIRSVLFSAAVIGALGAGSAAATLAAAKHAKALPDEKAKDLLTA